MNQIRRAVLGAKTYEPAELADKTDRTIQAVLLNKDRLQALEAAAKPSQVSVSTTASAQSQQLPKDIEKINADTAKYLAEVKRVLAKPSENEQATFTNEYIHALMEQFTVKRPELIFNMIHALEYVSFEQKKEISHIVGALLRRNEGQSQSSMNIVMSHVLERKQILDHLVKNYQSQKNDVALNSGQILRECIKNEELAKLVIEQHHLAFFDYANLASFDILSDAFSTFRDLMTRHKHMVKSFLEADYNSNEGNFLRSYNNRLIKSENYVTKRQSIKLLSEILLDKLNFNVMSKYVGDVDNLKVIMMLLQDSSSAITLEAFHIFKIFVANPRKAERVEKILVKNKEELIRFLTDFQNKAEDEQFQEERTYLIKQIKQLRSNTANESQSQTSTAVSENNTTSQPRDSAV